MTKAAKTLKPKPLVLNLLYATDDSCQFQYTCDGHHPEMALVDAAMDETQKSERDIPLWVIRQAPVRQVWARTVRSRAGENDLGDRELRYYDQPSRGAKAVTVMDFWFPLHRHVAKPLSKAA